jgi:hypothetical protein
VSKEICAVVTTCTLTIVDDAHAEYEDTAYYQRSKGRHVVGELGKSLYPRLVVEMLHRWVGDFSGNCRRDELIVLGRGLYQIAFGDARPFSDEAPPIQKAFEETYKDNKDKHQLLRLRLVLRPEAHGLGQLPWEFLYMPQGERSGVFLAGQDTELLLTRWVPHPNEWSTKESMEGGQLRILIVSSRPQIPGWSQLSEPKFMPDGIDDLRFETRTLDAPTKKTLRNAIANFRPHILHFFGHGRPNGLALCKDPERLAREDQELREGLRSDQPIPMLDESDWVDGFTAADLLGTGLSELGAPKRLIFLHSCNTATSSQTRESLDGFASLARRLIDEQEVSGVVAMQYTISVDQAEIFAKAFYRNIVEGKHVDAAVAAARKEFAETPVGGIWNSRDFGTPVIYLRREDPLVAIPISLPAQNQPADPLVGSVAAAPTTAPCPDPRCNGSVVRSANPPTCRLCKMSFAPCPRPTCQGLMIPKPSYGCYQCDYTYGDRLDDGGVPGRSMATAAVAPSDKSSWGSSVSLSGAEPVSGRDSQLTTGTHALNWPQIAGPLDAPRPLPEQSRR